FGTAKYQSKKLKAAGLQKLKFYCQLCAKQCRDANGFKNHLSSPSHIAKISKIQESGETSKLIEDYSDRFKSDFIRLLRINHGTKTINANRFYQEYIRDKDHVHMNSTRWRSLTSFVKYLGKNGIVKVEAGGDDDDDDQEGFHLEIRLVGQNEALSSYTEKNNVDDGVNDDKILSRQIQKGKELEKNVEEPKKIVLQPIPSGPIKLNLKKKSTTKKKQQNVFADGDDSE
ncbi:putative zinc finger protein, partial [Candida maltosa Xu316]